MKSTQKSVALVAVVALVGLAGCFDFSQGDRGSDNVNPSTPGTDSSDPGGSTPGTNPTGPGDALDACFTARVANAAARIVEVDAGCSTGLGFVRWDWTDDGAWDTQASASMTATHQFPGHGAWTIRLQVSSGGQTDTTASSVKIAEPSDGDAPRDAPLDASYNESGRIFVEEDFEGAFTWNLVQDTTYGSWAVSQSTQQSISGQRSLEFELMQESAGSVTWIWQAIAVDPEKQYQATLSADAWSDGASEANKLADFLIFLGQSAPTRLDQFPHSLEWSPAVGGSSTGARAALNQVAGWKTYDLPWQASAPDGWLYVGIGLASTWETSMTYYVDDIHFELVPVDEPVPGIQYVDGFEGGLDWRAHWQDAQNVEAATCTEAQEGNRALCVSADSGTVGAWRRVDGHMGTATFSTWSYLYHPGALVIYLGPQQPHNGDPWPTGGQVVRVPVEPGAWIKHDIVADVSGATFYAAVGIESTGAIGAAFDQLVLHIEV